MAKRIIERANGSKRVVSEAVGESLTEQHHANAVNINEIVLRYQKTGVLPETRPGASYGDFTGVTDYHQALQACRDAEDLFMSLPPQLRAKFENDPQNLFEFLNNEENRTEAEELGLVERRIPEDKKPPTDVPEPKGDVVPTPEGPNNDSPSKG